MTRGPLLRPDPAGAEFVTLLTPPDWAAVFGASGPLELEIGSGAGAFALGHAARYPRVHYVAIEWRKKYARELEHRARARGLTNLRVVEADARVAPAADVDGIGEADDTLTLLLMCCHPELTPASQVALTLRAVGGLTTAEIARAFLVPESTVAQRISRAKQKIKASGAQFRMPPAERLDQRVGAVLSVLYLIFTEGHTASVGESVDVPRRVVQEVGDGAHVEQGR